MGWVSDCKTLDDAKRSARTVVDNEDCLTLEIAVTCGGCRVWLLHEKEETGQRFIELRVIRFTDETPRRYGYADYCEAEGLSWLDCPVRFLDATVGRHEYEGLPDVQCWHEAVREYHAELASRRVSRDGATTVPGRFLRIALASPSSDAPHRNMRRDARVRR